MKKTRIILGLATAIILVTGGVSYANNQDKNNGADCYYSNSQQHSDCKCNSKNEDKNPHCKPKNTPPPAPEPTPTPTPTPPSPTPAPSHTLKSSEAISNPDNDSTPPAHSTFKGKGN